MKKRGTPTYDLIVIGGGPSGMMCAGRAAELGAAVLLLEKNKDLGKKLKITGGGRCNITNATFDVRAFLEHFPESKEFLFSPFSKFSAKDTFAFFEERGLPLVVEAKHRTFPATHRALDVFRVMDRYVRAHGVQIIKSAQVVRLRTRTSGEWCVKTADGTEYFAHRVAVATGGLAAPETGSTGDGFRFLQHLGIATLKPSPNVVPLTTDARWVHQLSGITLSFIKIRFVQDNAIKIRKLGKILFTHFGVSGPLILNSSYEVQQLLKHGDVDAVLDCFPDTTEGDLDKRIWRHFEKNKNKLLKNALADLIPSRLAETILTFPGLKIGEKKVHSVTQEERKLLTKTLKNLTFPITGTLGFKDAVIADGGVLLEEVNFKNMTSKKHPTLYLLGDILNINRPSGGFSLQLCWTTGWVAGTDAGSQSITPVRRTYE